MKKIIKAAIAVFLSVLFFLGGIFLYTQLKIKYYEESFFVMTEDFNSIPQKETWISDYIFDINDYEKLTGFCDYVFVGKIEKAEGTYYEDGFFNDLLQFYASPVTQYKIRILRNIKGNLILNEKIPMRKSGGLSLGGKFIEIGNGDTMPLEGEYYILFANADEKGEISISVGNISLGENESDALNEKSPKIKKILDAAENQDESVRNGVRYKSKYEQ